MYLHVDTNILGTECTHYFVTWDCGRNRPVTRHSVLSSLSALNLLVGRNNLPELGCIKEDVEASKKYHIGDNFSAETLLWRSAMHIYARRYMDECKARGEPLLLSGLIGNCTIDFFLTVLKDSSGCSIERHRISSFLDDVGIKVGEQVQRDFAVYMFDKATDILVGPALHVSTYLKNSFGLS
jgi:hypothetical protein